MFRDYITYYDHALGPALCDELIEMFESTTSNQGRKRVTNDVMKFDEVNLALLPEHKEKMDYLYGMYASYLNAYKINNEITNKQMPDRYGFEQIRLKKYNPCVDSFNYHTDVGDYASAKRFLVMMLYLNTVEHGGETEFPEYQKTIKPVKGRIVIFPSLWTHLHKGHTPISNAKFICSTYVHYV